MKYIALDIETTGLNPGKHQILSFGAVLVDTEDNETPVEDLPSFYMVVHHNEIVGQPYALALNHELLKIIKDAKIIHGNGIMTTEENLIGDFYRWMTDIFGHDHFIHNKNKLTLVGKNLSGFDLRFIEKLSQYGSHFKPLFHSHRVIDPAILYVDWQRDTHLPNLQTCLDRAGIDKQVTHNALEDARDIVRLIRGARG